MIVAKKLKCTVRVHFGDMMMMVTMDSVSEVERLSISSLCALSWAHDSLSHNTIFLLPFQVHVVLLPVGSKPK